MSDGLSPLFGWRGAIAASELDSTSKLVALTLSLYMSERGESAFPSVETLARDTSLTGRAVQSHLAKLVDGQWLRRVERTKADGSRDSNRYDAMRPEVVNVVHQGGEPDSPGVVNVDALGGERGSPESVKKAPLKDSGEKSLVSRRVVKTAWEARDPKPTAKFMNLVAMAQRFLDASWPEDELTAAMIATPAFTDSALEFQLRRTRERSPKAVSYDTPAVVYR